MASSVSNTVNFITSETLANSIGGTVLANTLQVTNVEIDGASFEFLLAGQSLPVTIGSTTTYPAVNVCVFAGGAGNNTDAMITSMVLTPPGDQNGAFIINGMITLRANNKTLGNGPGLGLVAQIPTVSLNGVDTIKTIYAGASSNGVVNANANTANISFWVQPTTSGLLPPGALNTLPNCNTSITQLTIWASNTLI